MTIHDLSVSHNVSPLQNLPKQIQIFNAEIAKRFHSIPFYISFNTFTEETPGATQRPVLIFILHERT